jgi:hypothetical protein
MSDIAHIIVLVLELYIALGMMVIGFGYMLAGKNGGSRAAGYYFGNSIRWTWWRLRRLVAAVLAALSGALMFWIIRPLAYRLWRGIHWFVTRQRGWLRP